jgi:hypothetical protein
MKHLSAVLLCLMLVGASACGSSGGAGTGGSSASNACAALPPATAPQFLDRLTLFMNHYCYEKEHWQHDAEVRSSDGVHLYVKVWYSPSLFKWMTTGNRQGPVPDGAILVKEEHTSLTAPLLLWSLMIKDSRLSWDGWYWAGIFPKSSGAHPASTPPLAGCSEPQPLAAGAGLYCLNCHASAIANSGTFASTDYLNPQSGLSDGAASSLRFANGYLHPELFRADATDRQSPDLAPGFTGRVPSSVFTNVRALPQIPCMVPEQFDHVVAGGKTSGGVPEFLTSDQCSGCHDSSGTLSGLVPHMIVNPDGPSPANLSPYGEWRYSMMGLAGRDPIFLAQLDTESTLHKHLAGKKNGAAFIQDLCLRCHGVMGQRQFHIDHGNGPGALFTRADLQDPKSKYGALARDGVSCTVCHHMTDELLQDPSTYTGLFKVGPPGEVYGPYPSDPDPSGAKSGDSVIPLPMENSVGITPKQGLQLLQANLCASCHTIALPVFDADGNQVIEDGEPKTDFEQTTFFEWLNSGFITVPCQTCHMPDSYQGAQLQFEIANIEDNTFPAVPRSGPSTRLPDSDLALQERTPYRRHTLIGINVFALEMFDQFRTDLGLFKVDPNLPSQFANTISSQRTAVAESVLQAQTKTAEVSVESATESGGVLTADVQVLNLAGHNLPSGVSFRRAFLNFQVLDSAGNILWASGNTNSDGVIVDDSGNPLVTEFFSPSQQTFQPHFWTGNPITSDQQVEIYEELVTDPQGMLTTSFLSLDHKVKDNRIQPTGRSFNGPNAAITAPVGTGDDPSYQRGCGCSVVRYQVPLTGAVANASAVRATLYYQSIPPYYLRQRSQQGHGPDTARLIDFVSQLNLSQYPVIADWKLELATSGAVDIK